MGSEGLPKTPAKNTGGHAGGSKRARAPTDTQEERKEREEEEEEGTPLEADEHYVTIRAAVVGVQYYDGLVGKGEYVMLRRQPQNQYDPNAIQTVNANGSQVGHIPRPVATKLAFLMDNNLITVEGRMVAQNLDGSHHYKLAMDISIYARPSLRPALEPELVWATPGQKGFEAMRRGNHGMAGVDVPEVKGKGKGKASQGRRLGDGMLEGMASGPGGRVGLPGPGMDDEMRRLLDGLQRIGDDEKHADGVMNALTGDIDVSKLPFHPSPPGLANGDLLVDIMPHQSQALQWMIDHEKPKLPATVADPPTQFWTRQKPTGKAAGEEYWLNIATRSPQKEVPVLGRGGIVADGMGLGKTLTVLSLILATKSEQSSGKASGATLVVCPLSVLSNWEKQIQDHVSPGQLSFYIYHGSGRSVTATTLATYDVVFTTYQTVAAEVSALSLTHTPSKVKQAKRTEGPLFQVEWKRVVADEGHVLKNAKAKMTQAFVDLKGELRWVLSGTPIVNSTADLGSLLTCLRVCKPLDKPDFFKTLLLRPLKNGDPAAGKLLQALVSQVLLRRTKESVDSDGQKLVNLPPIEYFQVPVALDEETRGVYDEIIETAKTRFEESMRTGAIAANVLALLTRLRQLCLSRELVPQSFLDDLRRPPAPVAPAGPAITAASLTDENKDELLDKLRGLMLDDEPCSICFEQPMINPCVSPCGHSYCIICIGQWLAKSATCPNDRNALTQASLLSLPPDDQSTYTQLDDDAGLVRSAKIDELVQYLKVFDKQDKSLVFSQFTSFLDRIAARLKVEGVKFCRFDGSLNAKKRQEVIADFQGTGGPVVMLISLKSGAVGLNLTAASNVFLCDPWWQSAIEAQAIDRIHRLGQRKTVRVFQLIAEDTVESKVLEIQKRKDALVAQAFQKTSKGQTAQAKRQARFDDMRELLGVK